MTMNTPSINNIIINIFFVLAFFVTTHTLNIDIILLFIFLFIVMFHKFSSNLKFLFPFILFGFVYLVEKSFGDFYRFEKTYLFLFLLFYIMNSKYIKLNTILSKFILLNVIFIYLEFLFVHLTGITIFQNTVVDYGFARHHSFFEDSNFYCYTVLIYIYYNFVKTGKINFWYLGSIIISMSASALVATTLLLIFLKYFRKILKYGITTRIVFFMISLIITIFYYLAVIHNDKLSEFSDNPVIKIKLVSLGIRLDIQNKGINQIINDSNYLTGSGINTAKKTNDLNLNLHNTYLQMFLEMGLITFGIVFLSLIIVMFNINILFLPLFSVMFVLGNFLEVFYFPLLIFILFLSKDYDFKERVK